MLHWALVFFVLAIVAAIVGFGGFVTGTLLAAAKVCFALFILLFVVSLLTRGGPSDPSGPYS